MKKILVVALSALLCLGVMAGCGGDNKPADDGQLVKLKVGASPTPHAEILAQVKEDLKAQGVDLAVSYTHLGPCAGYRHRWGEHQWNGDAIPF